MLREEAITTLAGFHEGPLSILQNKMKKKTEVHVIIKQKEMATVKIKE